MKLATARHLKQKMEEILLFFYEFILSDVCLKGLEVSHTNKVQKL